mmetsp:Transcript_776/g.1813  ORF Transcript_776/g.1813 Transcript_776/m.1813 type:complete len:1425 (+) Transcript_776:58-4332(+)
MSVPVGGGPARSEHNHHAVGNAAATMQRTHFPLDEVRDALTKIRKGAAGGAKSLSVLTENPSDEEMRLAVYREGALPILVASIRISQADKASATSHESQRNGKPRESLKLFDNGTEAQYAVLCISYLCRSKEVCDALYGCEALPSLVDIIKFVALKPIAEFAVTALIHFATRGSDDNRNKLGSPLLGATEAVVEMLSQNLTVAKSEKCTHLLSILSLNAGSRDRIRELGAIKHIVEKLTESKPEDSISKVAITCLLNLCASNVANKLEVAEAGGIVFVVKCLALRATPQKTKVTEVALALISSLCVGNDSNDAIIGKLGGIPPVVSLLASGLDSPAMVKAVTAAMHLVRDVAQNKLIFSSCGGMNKLLDISRSLGEKLVTGAVVERALLAMSNACYDCQDARSTAVIHGALLVAARLVFDQWSQRSLFKAAIALCAHLAHDRANIPALYELGVVDALVFYILREFGGQRTEDSKWWFSALKSLTADHQLSQDAVEDGGGRMLLNDVIKHTLDAPAELEALKVSSKSVFAAVLCAGGIHQEVLARKLADEEYFSTHAERLEKVQYSYDCVDPTNFRDSLMSVRVQREKAMHSMEEVVFLCASVQQLEDRSTAALVQARDAQKSAVVADSAKVCKLFADEVSQAATSACEAAEEADTIVSKIAKEMRDAEQTALLANLMDRLQPVRILAAASADSARHTSDIARTATAVAAAAMEQYDRTKEAEYNEMLTIASEQATSICACAVSLYYARQNVLHSEWALQGVYDHLTLSTSSASTNNVETSVMDNVAQIRVCIHNLQNVHDFLTRYGAIQCAEECEKMTIAVVASEKRAFALGSATDIAIASYRADQSMVVSLLEDIVARSYHEGEALMLEKGNKLWALLLSKRLRKKRNEAHQRILDDISDLSLNTILLTMDKAVCKVELLRCQSIVREAEVLLDYGNKVFVESEECCNTFLKCSVASAKMCQIAHDRVTSCFMEFKAHFSKCVSCTEILDPEEATKEMQLMWNLFSEMEYAFANVRRCFEEKAMRDRLTRAGILAAFHGTQMPEPSRDAALKGAVITGDERGVKALIVNTQTTAGGCDVKKSTTGGYTLLHEAAEHGFAKIAKLLIFAGADVTSRTVKGSTALLTAASLGHTETVSVILQAGGDPNTQNHQGSRALHVACMNGHGGVAGKLVKAGADRCAVDDKSNNAFHLAAVSGCAEAVCDMLGLEFDMGSSLPVLPVVHRKTDLLTLSSGPHPVTYEAPAPAIKSLLADSVARETLFAARARNAAQRTPLSLAASFGNENVVKALVRGAAVDGNETDSAGITPLHLAASAGHHAVIAVLIDEGGAHANKADDHGFTALHLAVYHQHEAAVKALLDRGASANSRTIDGKTVRDLASGITNSERLQALLNANQGLLHMQRDVPKVAVNSNSWIASIRDGATD